MFCPKCKAEYREGFSRCADCDVDLVPELPLEQEQHAKPEQHTEYETDKIKEFKELEKSADRYMFKQLLGLVLFIAAFIIISRYGGRFHEFYIIVLTGFLFVMFIHLLYKIYKKMRIKRS